MKVPEGKYLKPVNTYKYGIPIIEIRSSRCALKSAFMDRWKIQCGDAREEGEFHILAASVTETQMFVNDDDQLDHYIVDKIIGLITHDNQVDDLGMRAATPFAINTHETSKNYGEVKVGYMYPRTSIVFKREFKIAEAFVKMATRPLHPFGDPLLEGENKTSFGTIEALSMVGESTVPYKFTKRESDPYKGILNVDMYFHCPPIEKNAFKQYNGEPRPAIATHMMRNIQEMLIIGRWSLEARPYTVTVVPY